MYVVLVLAHYLITYPHILKEGGVLFQGTSQFNKYAKIFIDTISENKEELQILGIENENLDTHSCCKDIASMVAVGYTVLFPILPVYVLA